MERTMPLALLNAMPTSGFVILRGTGARRRYRHDGSGCGVAAVSLAVGTRRSQPIAQRIEQAPLRQPPAAEEHYAGHGVVVRGVRQMR